MHNVSSSVPSPAYKKRHVQIHQLNKIMQASTTDDNETILKGNFSFHISSEAWAIVGAPAMQPTGDLLPPQQRHSKRESTTASSPHLAKIFWQRSQIETTAQSNQRSHVGSVRNSINSKEKTPNRSTDHCRKLRHPSSPSSTSIV